MYKKGQNTFSQIETIPLCQNSNWFLLGLHNPIDFNLPLHEKTISTLDLQVKSMQLSTRNQNTQYPSLRFEHTQQNNSIEPLITTKGRGDSKLSNFALI